MFNFLKKTWKQEERKSSSPVLATSQEEESITTQPSPIQPVLDSPITGIKRSREAFEPDEPRPTKERPIKAAKTSTFDSIRNHLPEIVDSKDREDGVISLSLSTLKDQISDCAKQQNSEFSYSFTMGLHPTPVLQQSLFFRQQNVRSCVPLS